MSLQPLDLLPLLSSGRCWNFLAVRADVNDATAGSQSFRATLKAVKFTDHRGNTTTKQ